MSDVVYSGQPSGPQNPDIAGRPGPGNPAYGDIAAGLPAPVRKKFKRLREQAERSRRAFNELSGRRTETREKIAKLEDALSALTMPLNDRSRLGAPGHGLSEDSAQVRNAKLELASLREDLADIDARYGDRNNGTDATLVSSLENYIRRRSLFGLARHIEPSLRKGEMLPSAIDGRRRRINELKADARQVELAPWPSKMTKAKARDQLAELAKRGRPDVFALVERFDAIAWPLLPAVDPMQSAQMDSGALMAWALGPALVAAVEREIDELSDDSKSLTADERKHRTEEIRGEILAVEREEEALIELAEAQQLPVARRADADPRAVLGVS